MNEETKQESLLDGDFSCETTEDWGMKILFVSVAVIFLIISFLTESVAASTFALVFSLMALFNDED